MWAIAFPSLSAAFSISLPKASPKEVLTELVSKHDFVVMGKILDSNARFGNHPRIQYDNAIVTEYQLLISKTIKGKTETDTIDFILPGGCLSDQDICLEIDIIHHPKIDDHVVLFLKRTDQGSFYAPSTMYGVLHENKGKFYPLALNKDEIMNAAEQ
jgi:hypothetical protein